MVQREEFSSWDIIKLASRVETPIVSYMFLHHQGNYNMVVYSQGLFDILSLSGSYTCTELGGRTGGLRVCLSSVDGHIIGGGVGGPLTAAGPIQVIIV